MSYRTRVASEPQYIVVARRPPDWEVPWWRKYDPDTRSHVINPNYDQLQHNRWLSANQAIKSLQNIPVAGEICKSEKAAKVLVSKCRALGLEADYAKLEDVLQ